MTTEELARQAGAECRYYGTHPDGTNTFLGANFKFTELERFATLVRAQALADVVRMLETEHGARWRADNHALFYANMVRGLK